MPRFLTVSPTHIPKMKKTAWERFRDGGYIAIGFRHVDMTARSPDDVAAAIQGQGYSDEADAIDCFKKFLSLEPGDYVAVNNTNHGLFGIGVVTRGYHYEFQHHNTESEDRDQWYSHIVDIDWDVTAYMRRQDLIREGETMWKPYGTCGALLDAIPEYILRALGQAPDPSPSPEPVVVATPDFLQPIVKGIEILREDNKHQERAHESLVEDFLVALGYEKHRDIKFRQGRVDITIFDNDRPVVVFEIKRNWELNAQDRGVIKQAYNYSLEQGIRFVVITNGDYYLLMDRLKGLSFDTNVIGEFTLSGLQEDSLSLIDSLRPESLRSNNVKQIFERLSEGF